MEAIHKSSYKSAIINDVEVRANNQRQYLVKRTNRAEQRITAKSKFDAFLYCKIFDSNLKLENITEL